MKAFLACSVIALGLVGPIAVAQDGAGARARAAQDVIAQPSEEQLRRYAGAVKKVSAVAAEYQPRLQEARSEPERQAVRIEADRKMVAQVEAGGMGVDEYNGISRAVQRDPELRRKVEYLVNQ
ncbi:DUF4168 domain-containing protein [Castellaniella sp. GW247-6E4]|uniref:DUF4168 domain-containing protein n=1 Tax=Castellaniella sp. GW247-6E4 TaxID=3140380 RepID=UPI003315104F